MSKTPTPTDEARVKTLLVGIHAPYNKIKPIDTYIEEFISLVKTLGLKYSDQITMKLRTIDKTNFFTKGKLQELKKYCDENEIEEVVISDKLSPRQERNLGDILDCIIWGREKLILEIFRNAAHTAEGKIQVEMAEIEFLKTRLAGKGIELAQQEGIVGSKGPGETSKETLKRLFAEKLRKAKKKLDNLKKSRDIQRKRRLESNIPLICLVGYTNSGKSSLLNALTNSNVGVEDKLFATLDTTTRELFIDHKKVSLISDTVGFISQLPHHLVEAFKSTLDELQYANLLLHVVDVSNPIWKNQIKVVNETLEDLNVHKKIVFVFNKTDLLSKKELEFIKEKTIDYQPHVFANTISKEGLEKLKNFLSNYEFNEGN